MQGFSLCHCPLIQCKHKLKCDMPNPQCQHNNCTAAKCHTDSHGYKSILYTVTNVKQLVLGFWLLEERLEPAQGDTHESVARSVLAANRLTSSWPPVKCVSDAPTSVTGGGGGGGNSG